MKTEKKLLAHYYTGLTLPGSNLCKLKFFGLILWLLSIIFATSVHAKELKISAPTPPPHIFTRSAHVFVEGIEKIDPVNFSTSVYPLGQLGDTPAILSLLQSGAIEFAIVPVGDLARWEQAFSAWFLPFLFNDAEEAFKYAQTKTPNDILHLLESRGLVGLGYIFPGQRHLLSRFPVNSIADIANKKIRVFPNDIFQAWWKQVGAAPIALPLPQIAPSLMTGVLDGLDADLDIIVGLRFYEQAPYLTLTNHMSFPGVLLVSKQWWLSLSIDKRSRIQRVVEDLQNWGVEEVMSAEERNLKALLAAGVIVSTLDRADFGDLGEQVRETFITRDELIRRFYNGVAPEKNARLADSIRGAIVLTEQSEGSFINLHRVIGGYEP